MKASRGNLAEVDSILPNPLGDVKSFASVPTQFTQIKIALRML
jgi:hypothetical protein